jgi:hypothetical protein
MKLLLTHSTRKIDFNQCNLNFLTNRYKNKNRLQNLPELSTLTNEYCSNYTGAFSCWDWSIISDNPKLIHWEKKNYKVQQAQIRGKELILAGTAFLEIYKTIWDNIPSYKITHDLMAGNHLFEVMPNGGLVVSCSASDAILLFSKDGEFLEYLRVPEKNYGKNYLFPPNISLRDHYIHNDLQLTHLNSVHCYDQGFLISTLIQGDIGYFDAQKKYHVITSGFVGAHGVNSLPNGNIYFCDSCNGCINLIEKTGKIKKRYKVDTSWLQDARWIQDEIFLCALSDKNTFELWDFDKNKLIWKINCSEFGETTQFISLHEK